MSEHGMQMAGFTAAAQKGMSLSQAVNNTQHVN